MKLIKMTDYVLEHPATHDYEYFCGKILDYVALLKTTVSLGMFLPVDEEGSILNVPTGWGSTYDPENPMPDEYMYDYMQYKEAKEKILFDRFEECNRSGSVLCVVKDDLHLHNTFDGNRDLESLAHYELTINESAIKHWI